ncbi:MAG: FHA domain-containing protein [Cellvibrionaceae bacterium]
MKLILTIVNSDEWLAEQDRSREWVDCGGSIGRFEGNDWVLPDPESEISRVHARVYFEDQIFFLEDLSVNGVFVSEHKQRIEHMPYAISDGDSLFIGPYQINAQVLTETRLATDHNHADVWGAESIFDSMDKQYPSHNNQESDFFERMLSDFSEAGTLQNTSSKSDLGDHTDQGNNNSLALSENLSPSSLLSNTMSAQETLLEPPIQIDGLQQHINAQQQAFQLMLTTLLDEMKAENVTKILSRLDKDKENLLPSLYQGVFSEEYKKWFEYIGLPTIGSD